MSSFSASASPHKFSWQQTMLRIKDPAQTIPYYENHYGFKLIHKYDFPQWKFSLYFMAILPESTTCPPAGTKEAEAFLWSMDGVTLELTHNHGSETDPDFKVNNGNVEPYRGFGHLAVMTPDVYASCAELETNGVKFQKRPDEGRMKGIAFALDPDGYWIEVIPRLPDSKVTLKYTFAQTMFRVKDATKALHFYQKLLGLTLLRSAHFGVGTENGFSLYFLASLTKEELAEWQSMYTDDGSTPPTNEQGSEFMKRMFSPILELTHNHGTETKPDFKYHNGNDQDAGQVRGFGHVGFLVDDLDAACTYLEQAGVAFKKKPAEGGMRGLAFVYDPDGYWVEIIQRGVNFD